MALKSNNIERIKDKVVTNCEYLLSIKYSQTHPYVFTEQRVAFPRPCDAQLPVPAYRSKVVRQSHDRFLCLANTVYHIDISLKDLGNRWFSFNKMEMTAKELLGNV